MHQNYLQLFRMQIGIIGQNPMGEIIQRACQFNSGKPAARYNEYCIGRIGNGWRVEMIGRSVAAAPEHVWESERRVLRER